VGEVLTREEIVAACEAERVRGSRVVFTNGCFDILHRGHVYYLEKAAELGDVLVVGVNSDRSVRELKGPSRPVIPEDDRAHLVASLASVRYVCVFDEATPYELIRAVGPDVLVKGAGYERETIVGADLVEARGGEVTAIEELPGRSSRAIIRRIIESGGEE
jgi:rfaE bifunctional protein nucleotidyltransferase chain/domain